MPSREGRANRTTFEIEGHTFDRPGSNGWKMFDPEQLNDILADVSSFYFRPTVKSEVHCYVLAERKQRGGKYWVAYRKADKKQYKAYIGKVGGITFQRLSDVAKTLDEKVKAAKSVKRVPPMEQE